MTYELGLDVYVRVFRAEYEWTMSKFEPEERKRQSVSSEWGVEWAESSWLKSDHPWWISVVNVASYSLSWFIL